MLCLGCLVGFGVIEGMIQGLGFRAFGFSLLEGRLGFEWFGACRARPFWLYTGVQSCAVRF